MSWMTIAQLRRDTANLRALTQLLLDGGGGDGGHRLVWTLFATDPNAKRDFLFRESRPGEFLIISARKPEADEAIWSLKSRPYAPAPPQGARLGFSLRANPTVSVSQEGRKRSHRADVVMHMKKGLGRTPTAEERGEAILQWLESRADRIGVTFDLSRCRVLRHDILSPSIRPRTGKDKARRFALADIDGVLRVEDPSRLGRALVEGIGHGRAYGMGLLLLRPLEEA